MERFVHYADKPLTEVKESFQIGGRAERGYKPNGLWFSVDGGDDSWRHCCESKNFNLHRLTCQTEITFRPDAKVLRLTSARAIDKFTEQFAGESMGAPWHRPINWRDVAARWHGIIIAPYCLERRLSDHTFWYYGWDCASGVVWCPRAVQTISPNRGKEMGR